MHGRSATPAYLCAHPVPSAQQQLSHALARLHTISCVTPPPPACLPARPQVFVGNHGKQVSVWVPPAPELDSRVLLDDHCGWVRSLAIAQGRWLFSCACNTLRQWDMSRAVPRCAATVSLDKGDILALVARKDRVYAASADGSIRWDRSWRACGGGQEGGVGWGQGGRGWQAGSSQEGSTAWSSGVAGLPAAWPAPAAGLLPLTASTILPTSTARVRVRLRCAPRC